MCRGEQVDAAKDLRRWKSLVTLAKQPKPERTWAAAAAAAAAAAGGGSGGNDQYSRNDNDGDNESKSEHSDRDDADDEDDDLCDAEMTAAAAYEASEEVVLAEWMSSKAQARLDAAGRSSSPLTLLPKDHYQSTSRAASPCYTPLHLACSEGNEDMVRVLLDCGADAYARARDGRTPLHIAAGAGACGVMKILIDEARADVAAVDCRGRGPLHEACSRGRYAAARLLLDHGSAIGMLDYAGASPLHVVVLEGNFDDVEREGLELGPMSTGSRLGTPRSAVAERDGDCSGGEFCSGGTASRAGEAGEGGEAGGAGEAGGKACASGEAEAKADVEAVRGVLARLGAVSHLRVMRLLLDRGADPACSSLQVGRSARSAPLHVACARGEALLVDELLRYGVDPNQRASKTTKSLQAEQLEQEQREQASEKRYQEREQVREDPTQREQCGGEQSTEEGPFARDSQSGAPIELAGSATWPGDTPLQIAARNNHASLVPILLKGGADIDASGALPDRATALCTACKAGRRTVVGALVEAGARINEKTWVPPELRILAKLAARETTKGGDADTDGGGGGDAGGDGKQQPAVLKKKQPTTSDAPTNSGVLGGGGATALHYACDGPDEQIVEFLLDPRRAAEVNATSQDGSTALHISCDPNSRCWLPGVARLLLASGAVVDAKDGQGRTALQRAVTNDLFFRPGITEGIELLIRCGANPYVRDGRKHGPASRTPFDLVRAQCNRRSSPGAADITQKMIDALQRYEEVHSTKHARGSAGRAGGGGLLAVSSSGGDDGGGGGSGGAAAVLFPVCHRRDTGDTSSHTGDESSGGEEGGGAEECLIS